MSSPATIRVLPVRTCRVAGLRIVAGVTADLPAAAADLALRQGWAVPAAADAPQPAAPAADAPRRAPPRHARKDTE